jgi:hypothetical protein
MIHIYVDRGQNGFECFWAHGGERWTGETIPEALRTFERDYIDTYGRRPIYYWT